MLFHFTSWTFGSYSAEDFLGRIGLYGVSAFYVLSGLTLFLIYFNNLKPTIHSLASFAIKRTFRIFPLLWLVVGATLVLNPKLFDPRLLFLSLTGLFGYFEPAGGIGTGVWSIGNELVFYAIFPILLIIAKFNRLLFLILSGLLMAVSIYFAFYIFQQNQPLGLQWGKYVNPLNQVILFVGGMLLGYFTLNFSFGKPNSLFAILMLAAAFLLFIFYPAAGDRIVLVADWSRIFFLAISFVICAAVYLGNFQLPFYLHKPLAFTGEVSYGLYLLHPLVYTLIFGAAKIFKLNIGPEFLLMAAFISAFIASYLVFRFFETPMIKAGKYLTSKLSVATPK